MQGRRETEVWQACDDLIAMGLSVRQITGEAIANRLRELGYKAGNPNYRYKYRESWRRARGLSREDEGPAIEQHDTIDRAAALFRQQIETTLKDEYEQKYQTALETVQHAESQLAQHQEQHQRLQTERKTLEQDLSECVDQKAVLEKTLHASEQSMLVQQERLRHTEVELATLRQTTEKQQKKLCDDYENRLTFLKTQLAEANKAHKAERDDMKALMKEVRQEHQHKIDMFNVTHGKLEKQHYQLNAKNQILEEQNNLQEAKLERLQEELSLLRKENQQLTTDLDKIRNQLVNDVHERERTIATLQGELTALKKQNEHQEQQYHCSQEKLLSLQEKNSRFELELSQRQGMPKDATETTIA